MAGLGWAGAELRADGAGVVVDPLEDHAAARRFAAAAEARGVPARLLEPGEAIAL